MSKSRGILLIAFLVLAALATLSLVILWPHLEGNNPEIALDPHLTHLGRDTPLVVSIKDADSGLSLVKVILIQGTKEHVLFEQNYAGDSTWAAKGQEVAQINLRIKAQEMNLAQGPASLIVQARDRSFRGWMHGNLSRLELPVTVATIPPRLTVLSRTIHLNRGGVGLAIYRAGETASVHGVQVGKRTFFGKSPWPQDREARLCYFAFSDDEEQNAPVRVFAQDPAGNQSTAGLTVRLKWKQFKQDQLNIGDEFLNAMTGRFAGETPPDRQATPLDLFLWVNEELRRQNHDRIVAAVGRTSTQQLWRGVFYRPQGKPMAGYADRRSYMYKGREVSKSTHLGVDLADLAASPIRSAAAGKIALAAPLGIYGNCVIVDHGQGIATLYGHMSELQVQVGQDVAMEQTLGLSGATGLALGDHLHFSLLVGGVFVSPIEWWDPHWIKDNVELRFQEAGLPWPGQPGQPRPAS